MSRVGEVRSEFEDVVLNDENIRTLIETNEEFAREMYGAMTNRIWVSPDKHEFRSTWRYAATFIALVAGRGEDHLDYYCSGYEGELTERVRAEMERLGWSWVSHPDEERSK